MSTSHSSRRTSAHSRPPRGVSGFVLVVIMVLYTGFAIPVSVVAMGNSFFFGLALAAFLAYQWTRLPAILTGMAPESASVEDVAPQMPETTTTASSGNASFDAYRSDVLGRLEREQEKFEGFVTRLRAAKDATEFDAFMEARANDAQTRRISATDLDTPTELAPERA
ncbi:DUF2852 domain-containing protein [Primorskyibacter sp. S187A]|uniref:DUF2852 domain-containing protein n=1 Tax=Primorskyibacter sp. S187A TaxID=3415130 RepID=UPI003C7A18D2